MPFQDLEDDEVQVVRTPGAVESLLRKIFVEDLGLKLAALGITLFIWFAVTEENKPVTIVTAVQLTFIEPDNLAVSSDPPRRVEVLLHGSRHKLNNLRMLDLVATVNLNDSKPGDRVIRLTPERVTMELPPGITIESFQPANVPIKLEPVVERSVPVDVRIEGTPANGYEVYGTQPSKSTVTITGPVSHVNQLQRAPTETIAVDGRKDTFTATRVAIAIPDEKIDAVDTTIDVTVDIGEKRVEKKLDNVPVRSALGGNVAPSNATVTIAAPAHLVDQLNASNLTIVVEKTSKGETVPKLQSSGVPIDRLKLVSITPSVFH